MNTMEANVEEQADKASKKVFAIPELLEGILLNIRIKDLLHAQRVSKALQATINGSSKLQQALFFEPVPLNAAKIFPERDAHYPIETPPLAKYRKYAGRNVTQCMHRRAIVRNPLWKGVCVKKLARKREAIDRPEASWRRMLLSQPPTRVSTHTVGDAVMLGDLKTRQFAKRFFESMLFLMHGWRQVVYASEVHDIMNEKAIVDEWIWIHDNDGGD